MKLAKRISALLLALVLVLGMTMTASAETTTPATPTGDASGVGSGTGAIQGTITINDAVAGETYTIYKLLDLESYNRAGGKNVYSYKTAAAWSDWLKTQTTYVTVDGNDYVEWVKNADAEAFAKAALKYAKENKNKITATDTKTAEGTTVVFEDLDLGYYLLDTSLGALCSLDSTDQEIIIAEKNTAPTIDKQVQEDSEVANADKGWKDVYGSSLDADKEGTFNTAQIGDTVNFKTIIKAYKGAENYVLHDKMSSGFTLVDTDATPIAVDGLTKGRDYNVVTSGDALCADCDFHIVFTEDYLKGITGTTEAPTELTVIYSAILNDAAVVYNGNATTDVNTNDTKLTYGDSRTTEWDQTVTYTYKFNISKVNSSGEALTGAEFELYDAEENGNKISVKLVDGIYRIATAAEKEANDFQDVVISAGNVTITGLDDNTSYWLKETKAPTGYNALSERERVRVNIKQSEGAFETETVTENGADVNKVKKGEILPSGTITVINEAGVRLPSTGGIGTTIFYAAGGALVLVAVVLLVTRRRMENEK